MTQCSVVFAAEDVLHCDACRRARCSIDAARRAGLDLHEPCGGQGRCGRCAVIVDRGAGAPPLHAAPGRGRPGNAGYALACQTRGRGRRARCTLLPQEQVERRLLTSDRARPGMAKLPGGLRPWRRDQPVVAPCAWTLEPPSLADQTDDWARLQRGAATQRVDGSGKLTIDLAAAARARRETLRVGGLEGHRRPRAGHPGSEPDGPPRARRSCWPATDRQRLLRRGPRHRHHQQRAPPCGPAQLGKVLSAGKWTTTGRWRAGEDVIARIIYAGKRRRPGRTAAIWSLHTFNRLLAQGTRSAARCRKPRAIYKATVAGNSTMIHLFLGLPPQSIRLAPFVTTVNQPPTVRAHELGLAHPPGRLRSTACPAWPATSARTLQRRRRQRRTAREPTSSRSSWMSAPTARWCWAPATGCSTCACSAGPAFEGRGRRARHARHGRRHRGSVGEQRDARADLPRDRRRRTRGHLRLRAARAAGRAVHYRGDRSLR
jgi:ferredoxin